MNWLPRNTTKKNSNYIRLMMIFLKALTLAKLSELFEVLAFLVGIPPSIASKPFGSRLPTSIALATFGLIFTSYVFFPINYSPSPFDFVPHIFLIFVYHPPSNVVSTPIHFVPFSFDSIGGGILWSYNAFDVYLQQPKFVISFQPPKAYANALTFANY
jgi:hypothetical protein